MKLKPVLIVSAIYQAIIGGGMMLVPQQLVSAPFRLTPVPR